MTTDNDAKLIDSYTTRDGITIELRCARSPKQTWPNYHHTCPLGKRGYWIGRHESHRYVGQSKEAALSELGEVE